MNCLKFLGGNPGDSEFSRKIKKNFSLKSSCNSGICRASIALLGDSTLLFYRDPIVGQLLLLLWSQDQIQGAQQALSATAYALRKLKKDAQKTRQVKSSLTL